MRNAGFWLMAAGLLLLVSCEKNPVGTSLNQGEQPLAQFNIRQVWYNVLMIGSDNDISVPDSNISAIIFGEKENLQFAGLDTVKPEYVKSGDQYNLIFWFARPVSEKLINYSFTLRFMKTDGQSVDVDTTVSMLQFPYKNVQVYIKGDTIRYPQLSSFKFQDFVIEKDVLYFHPVGAFGLYRYDLPSGIVQELANYPGGDHIAASPNYVFYDFNHSLIQRYNKAQGTQDLRIDLPTLLGKDFVAIRGLSCYQGTLYVLYLAPGDNSGEDVVELATLSLDGALINTTRFDKQTYFISIDQGILYSINLFTERGVTKLTRFNLEEHSFLEERPFPTNEWEGIQVMDGKFYFVDYNKNIIAYVPLEEIKNARPYLDIRNIQQLPNLSSNSIRFVNSGFGGH